MKKMMVFGIAAALTAGTFADTLYVDPTGGTVSSDDYDGTAETWQGGTVGPMKTLAAVAAKAGEVATKSNPCTIIALPGEYREGVSNPEAIGTAETLNRVSVPQYVTLVSRDGRDKTFIIGAASDAPDATSGCGTNATRCVVGSGTVQGFTLTGGHTFSYVKSIASSGSKAEGGAAKSAMIVDCVVSNNFAYRGGGNAYGKNVRCVFRDNKVAYTGHNNQGGTSYNCLFVGGEAYSGTYYNCTFGKSSYPRTGDCYNSLVLLKGSPNGDSNFYRCYHLSGYNDHTILDPECVEFESAAAIRVDAEGRPTDAASPILDAGSETYYNRLSNAPTAKELDVEGLPRLMGGAVDIGCYERNPCDDFSALLSAQGAVTVTNVTPFVSSDREAQVVAVGVDQTLLATLNRFGESGLTTWKFFAEVKGSGTLKIYFGDAEDPQETVVEADGKIEVSYAAADSTALKLVYEGTDGTAEVSRFANHRSVKIVADSEGVVVVGDFTAVGEYGIGAGETKTFTVARANNPAKFVRGIEVNGEFVDFNDYPDGKTFTVSGDDYYSGLEITTVYADSVNEWFVDAVNGNDETNCGYYANMAFKTLAKAARTATESGDVITALPGVYNEGGMSSKVGGCGSNRVVLADGVWLRSRDGAAVTTIEGKISDQATNGIGPDSMRCAFLNGDAVISGFTMTKGRTNDALSGNNANGGAVYGGLCVDCVFTNNVGKNGGNAASSGKLLRCYLGSDPSGSYTTYLSVTLIDCVNNSGKAVRQNTTAYSTTFVSGGFSAGSNYPNKAYNCKFLSDAPTVCTLYRCYSNKAKGGNVTEEDGCKFSQKAEDLAYDPETCRPLKGSIAIDAANAAYYVRATNGWSKLWQSFIGTDYAGGQRVYNGKIDIGAGEYDWRGDFGKTLAKRGVAVAYASEGVTTNEVTGVDLATGEKIVVVPTLKTPGKVSFTVTAPAEGTVTVMRGETELIPEGGVYSFDGVVGENEAVSVAFAGEGVATVSGFDLPKLGVLLIVR